MQVTLDGSNHITAVTVLESPGTAAALAQLECWKFAPPVRIATDPGRKRVRISHCPGGIRECCSQEGEGRPRRRRVKKKAAQKRADGLRQRAWQPQMLFGSRECRGAARSAVGSANSTIAAANAEITLHETSQV